MKFKKIFTLLIFCFLYMLAQGQKLDSVAINSSWSPYKLGIHTAIGFQKTVYSEIGLSYHSAYFDINQPASSCFYSAFSWVPTFLPKKSDNIYGLNFGFENNSSILASALEVKYLTDFNGRQDFLIIPKIGLGVFGLINVLYGYSIPIRNNFQEIGKNQFSVTLNINKYIKKKKQK